ncbi:hypothetical protein WMY93_022491 [Mugilogobius chulae]|uniref:Uncharacterized protein n=1 Tax=Mugilogobius chulae TaxID=88201 RepID=A0AAW0NBE7_9GOBI
MARDFPRPGPELPLDTSLESVCEQYIHECVLCVLQSVCEVNVRSEERLEEERPTTSPDQVEAGELEVSSPLVPLRHSPVFAPSDEEDLSDTYSIRLSAESRRPLGQAFGGGDFCAPQTPPLPPVPANVDDLILSPPRRRPRDEDDEDQEERPRSKRRRRSDRPGPSARAGTSVPLPFIGRASAALIQLESSGGTSTTTSETH